MKKLLFLVMVICLLFAPSVEAQSIFGRPILVSFEKSTSDDGSNPNAIYFIYRTTLNSVTGKCNQFSKLGGVRNSTSFLDTQAIPGITYCYDAVFYNGTTQGPLSGFPAVVTAQ
jgi:hypothetical protein